MKDFVVLVGTGSIGQATARRVSAGKHVVLGDLKLEATEIFDGGTTNRFLLLRVTV